MSETEKKGIKCMFCDEIVYEERFYDYHIMNWCTDKDLKDKMKKENALEDLFELIKDNLNIK